LKEWKLLARIKAALAKADKPWLTLPQQLGLLALNMHITHHLASHCAEPLRRLEWQKSNSCYCLPSDGFNDEEI
jgi:hypothetical protein